MMVTLMVTQTVITAMNTTIWMKALMASHMIMKKIYKKKVFKILSFLYGLFFIYNIQYLRFNFKGDLL